MANFYQYYKELPAWAKGVVIVGGVGLVFVVGRPIYKKLFPSPEEKANTNVLKDSTKSIKDLKSKGMVSSIPETQYSILANQLYNLAGYNIIGNQYGQAETILKNLKNDLEVALLINAYGVRKTHDALFPFGEDQDLFSMVKSKIGNDMLNTSAITHGSNWRLKEINSDWAKKGITYKL